MFQWKNTFRWINRMLRFPLIWMILKWFYRQHNKLHFYYIRYPVEKVVHYPVHVHVSRPVPGKHFICELLLRHIPCVLLLYINNIVFLIQFIRSTRWKALCSSWFVVYWIHCCCFIILFNILSIFQLKRKFLWPL